MYITTYEKLFIIIPLVLLVAGFLIIFQIQRNVTNNVVSTLERAKSAVQEGGSGELSYGKVSTNALSQTVTINDVLCVIGSDDLDVQQVLKVDQLQFSQKLGAVDEDGNITTFNGVAKGLEYTQKSDFGDLSGLGIDYLKYFSDIGYVVDELSFDFDGCVPQFDTEKEFSDEDMKLLILTFFAHDQYIDYKLKNYRLESEFTSHPFFSQLTAQQKEQIKTYGDLEYSIEYQKGEGVFYLEMPQCGNGMSYFEGSGKCEVNAEDSISSGQLEDIKIGECSLEYFAGLNDKIKGYKFGDGAAFGEHKFGEVKLGYDLEADFTDVDFGEFFDSDVEPDPMSAVDLMDGLNYSVEASLSEIDLSFDTNPVEEKRFGRYNLEELKLGIKVDCGKLVTYLIPRDVIDLPTPTDPLSGYEFNFEVNDLGASVPETVAPLLMMMGIPDDVIASPQIEELKLAFEPKNGKLDLSKSLSLKSNFGSIASQGRVDLATTAFEGVSVQVDDCPIGLVMMLGGMLPEEQLLLIDQTTTTHNMSIEGSIAEGLQYQYSN